MTTALPDSSNSIASSDEVQAHSRDNWISTKIGSVPSVLRDQVLFPLWDNTWPPEPEQLAQQKLLFAAWQSTSCTFTSIFQTQNSGPMTPTITGNGTPQSPYVIDRVNRSSTPQACSKFIAVMLEAEDLIQLIISGGGQSLFADLPQTADKTSTKYLSFGWDGTGDYLQGTFVPTAPKVFVQLAQG